MIIQFLTFHLRQWRPVLGFAGGFLVPSMVYGDWQLSLLFKAVNQMRLEDLHGVSSQHVLLEIALHGKRHVAQWAGEGTFTNVGPKMV